MREKEKRKYWQFFLKHLKVWLAIGLFFAYLILQNCFRVIFDQAEATYQREYLYADRQLSMLGLQKDVRMQPADYQLALWRFGAQALPDDVYYSFGSNSGLIPFFSDGFGALTKSRHYCWIKDYKTGEILCENGGEGIGLLCVEIADKPTNGYGDFQDNEVRYYCPYQYLTEFQERLSYWEQQINNQERAGQRQIQVGYGLLDFYLKDGFFLPGNLEFHAYEHGTGLKSRDIYNDQLLETMDLTPSDVTGYEHYLTKDYDKKVHMQYYGQGRVADDSFREAAKKYYEKWAKESNVDVSEWMHSGRYKAESLLHLFHPADIRFADRSTFFNDGKLYEVCYYQEYSDIFVDPASVWMGYGIPLLFLICLATLFTAWLDWSKNRIRFLTEGYRDVLMDSMAHDLKSPLMAVGGYAENLKESLDEPGEEAREKSKYYADKILGNVGYLNSIVMKNLEILKYDHAVKKLKKSEVDVKKLFEEALLRRQEEIGEKKINVTVEGEMKAYAEEELMQKVAENLITNCIHYTPEGGAIKALFGTRRIEIQNVTELSYKGDLKKLWEPFVRGEDSRTGRGTGLGLAIVANILDRHKWKYQLSYEKETKTFSCIIKVPLGLLF